MDPVARVAPNSIDAEVSVLGSILLDNDTLINLGDQVNSDMFYRESHRKIFSAMRLLADRGQPIDLVTLSEELRAKNVLDEVGGVSYLVGLSESVPTAVYAEYYARIIQEKFTLRQLIQASGKIMQLAYDGEVALDELLDKSEQLIFDVSQKEGSDEFQSMNTVMHDTFEYITKLHATGGHIEGTKSGFRDLDSMITGFSPGSLNVLAARPSMGKTAFALSIAQNVALRGEGKTTAVFSLEMPAQQLALRMLCSEARVDMNRVRSGQLSEQDFVRLANAAARLSEAPIYIDDVPNLTANELRSKLRRVKTKTGSLGLVVIDYLQLMSGSKGGGGENRQQEISAISRGLKGIARELEVPVIVLSQLSRAVEQRPNHRPMLSDLRESGAIEQDADIVMFIYRDEYYNKETDQQGIAEIIIGKQRNGPVGTVKLQFHSQHVRFNDLAQEGV